MQVKKQNQYTANRKRFDHSNKAHGYLLYFQFWFCVLLFFSCNNYADPSIEKLASYSFSSNNNTLIGEGGEYLKDSIFIKIYNKLAPDEIQNFKIEFSVASGGGIVDDQQVVTDENGFAKTYWKLGKESFNQTVLAKIYDPQGKYLSRIPIKAYGMLYNAWNEVDFEPLSTVSDVASDTLRHRSWLISLGNVYTRGVNFLDWQQIDEPMLNGAREIEIDKNGVVYIGTWYGELLRSTDHGDTWIKCANPIPDRPYHFFFWITNDGDLWATHYERGLWHSKDGGTTWLNPVNVSGTYFNMNGAYRLKNGWLLSMIDSSNVKTVIMKSEDDGMNWSSVPTPKYPYSFYVTDQDEIIVFTQGSAGIYKSSDLGQSYKLVHAGFVTFNTGSNQSYVHKFGPYYYMAVPGFGVLKTSEFEHFERIFSEPNVNGLYIDHTGSVVVKGCLEKLNRSFFFGRK